MGIGLQQNLTLTQQLVMTPQLQQAIKLLQLSRLELASMIQQEMEENPALEEESIKDVEPSESEHEKDKEKETDQVKEVTIDEKVDPDNDWESYINEYNSTGKIYTETDPNAESTNFEAFTSSKKTLGDHLEWQLMMHGVNREQERIGSLIIGNLNIDGYLRASVEEIALEGPFASEKVEELLKIMQNFDPPGVCAQTLQESLIIQINHLGIKNRILEKIIADHMKNLENKNYKKIAQTLNVSLDTVKNAVNVIKNLEPKPGRKFSNEEPYYITPDIYVYKDGDDYKIMMNDDGLPKLKVSRFYRETIANGKEISKEAKAYLNERMQSASWLVKSIHQRQKTIYSVMESIVKYQKEFFDKGIAYLKPMILRDVAEDIEMHESTISRVTTNKYAFTPQGLFELKFFFNSSINRSNGDSLASASVKEKIKNIIEQENPANPYSDSKLSELLEEANIKIARRTVAKYREMLHILPSSKRKQF